MVRSGPQAAGFKLTPGFDEEAMPLDDHRPSGAGAVDSDILSFRDVGSTRNDT
jgi:hypothetical protein